MNDNTNPSSSYVHLDTEPLFIAVCGGDDQSQTQRDYLLLFVAIFVCWCSFMLLLQLVVSMAIL